MKPNLTLTVVITCVACASSGNAAVSLTNVPYTQNFDTLSNVDGTVINSTSLPTGWELSDATYKVDNDGGDTNQVFFSYGSTGSSDRALGAVVLGTTRLAGISFINNTGGTITSLNIAYRGEQWQSGSSSSDKWLFQFSSTATALEGLGATGFAEVPVLTFHSPNPGAPNGGLNGNSLGNFTAISGTVGVLNIPTGGTFWIRWAGSDGPGGSEDGLGIDDLVVAVPESGTVALVAAGVLVSLVRRRR